jgi:DNA mismatch repair protein PMS2
MYTNKNKDITSNISNIFGAKILSQIIPFQINLDKGSVEGYISKPEWGLGRSSSDRQHFFVNGRPCVLPKVIAMFIVYGVFIKYKSRWQKH